MTIVRNRPLRAPDVPPMNEWPMSGIYAVLSSAFRRGPRTTIWVVRRVCPHGGTWVDDRASDPRVANAWGVNIHSPCDSKRCARHYREHNQ